MRAALAFTLLAALAACGGGGGSVSTSAGLVAEKIGNVPGPGACGVRNALKVREVSGVRLSTPATLTPRAANALNGWIRSHALPTIGRKGGGLVQIRVAAHYACRTRNGRRGARLSEHALGNAIDISAFVLADGSRITVLEGWNGRDSRLMRRLHRSACGPFGTVLGPNSDRFHRDHFHFDVASHRNGPYCR